MGMFAEGYPRTHGGVHRVCRRQTPFADVFNEAIADGLMAISIMRWFQRFMQLFDGFKDKVGSRGRLFPDDCLRLLLVSSSLASSRLKA
ncbi:hypothetical protein OSB04_009505 [Centaurea solstitialis]|uniref:Uncharacterized protein n=1 Tax=Centaurea solstitialis TaxID=347529 RepID=A0AA38TGM5_9ASTR|nr:hypothetical protein OSB04_009505 [Centaurea solstitialis]